MVPTHLNGVVLRAVGGNARARRVGGGASGGTSGPDGTVASTSGSVESLRAAAEESTPLSKVRLQLAALIQTELARPD